MPPPAGRHSRPCADGVRRSSATELAVARRRHRAHRGMSTRQQRSFMPPEQRSRPSLADPPQVCPAGRGVRRAGAPASLREVVWVLPVRWRKLPEDVKGKRWVANAVYERTAADLQPRIDGHLQVYGMVLDALDEAHRQIGDNTDMDLAADSRQAAVWIVGGRCISGTRAALALLAAGFGAESATQERAVHEATRLLGALADDAEPELLQRWLADDDRGWVRPRDTRDAQERLRGRVREAMIAARAGAEEAGDAEQVAAIDEGLQLEGMQEDAALRSPNSGRAVARGERGVQRPVGPQGPGPGRRSGAGRRPARRLRSSTSAPTSDHPPVGQRDAAGQEALARRRQAHLAGLLVGDVPGGADPPPLRLGRRGEVEQQALRIGCLAGRVATVSFRLALIDCTKGAIFRRSCAPIRGWWT
jgi:hypothetical protein